LVGAGLRLNMPMREELEHEGKRTKVKLVRPRWYDPENKIVRG